MLRRVFAVAGMVTVAAAALVVPSAGTAASCPLPRFGPGRDYYAQDRCGNV